MVPKVQSITGALPDRKGNLHHRLNITPANLPSEPVRVKAAIYTPERLEIFEKDAPFDYVFTAKSYFVFYESLNINVRLVAELISYENEEALELSTGGSPMRHSGTSGRGMFIMDPDVPFRLCGGSG